MSAGTENPKHDDAGSVTAEFALGLPAVIMVLLLAVSLGMHGAAQVSLQDGARAAARELARGETIDTAEATALQRAGDGVAVQISTEGEYSVVRLSRPVQVLGMIQLDTEHTAEAAARTEHVSTSGGPP